jgi:hypothetical protein
VQYAILDPNRNLSRNRIDMSQEHNVSLARPVPTDGIPDMIDLRSKTERGHPARQKLHGP